MEVFSFLTPYMRSMTYVVTEMEHAFLVDPCEMDAVKSALDGRTVDFAFLTHEHYDHISGTDWARALGAEIVASEACGRNLGDVKLNHSKYYGAFCAAQERLRGDPIPKVRAYATHADRTFGAELAEEWQGHGLFFKSTPGHSTGGACLLVDGKSLFSGDTVFRDVPSNPDMMCGSAEDLERSVAWVLSLPGDVMVYPGHYEPFTVKERKNKELEQI